MSEITIKNKNDENVVKGSKAGNLIIKTEEIKFGKREKLENVISCLITRDDYLEDKIIYLESEVSRLENKMDSILELLGNKELSNHFEDKTDKKEQCHTLEIGKLTDETAREFNLGPYSK